MGGQAFDGCGEYMAASPDSLKCAACGCHRRAGGVSGLTGVSGAAPFFFSPPPPPPPPSHHHPVLQGFVPTSRPPQLALPYHAVSAAAWHHGLLDPSAAACSGSEAPPVVSASGREKGIVGTTTTTGRVETTGRVDLRECGLMPINV